MKKKQLIPIRSLFVLTTFLLLFACHNFAPQKEENQYSIDSTAVVQYIKKGNKIYATHTGLNAFAKSMLYYDSAWQIAYKTQDTFLLAVSYFAKGRAYDAWNNEPQKTIECFEQAAQLYKHLPEKYYHYLYINELIAHAFEKNKDSSNAIKTLVFTYGELIGQSDSTKKEMNFIPQMALVSTEVHNYLFAEKILDSLYKREWIVNDSESYNYLDYYYLTKARIEVYAYHKKESPYIDSFERVFYQCKNLSDSTYYAFQLHELYQSIGNDEKKYWYAQKHIEYDKRYNNLNSVVAFQKTLNQIERANILKQMELEQKRLHTQSIFLWLLSLLILVITSLGIFLYKRNKEIAINRNELFKLNNELHKKNQQNELLNKELHHRVKNNLQMILSLIYMQERNIQTDEAKQNLQEIRLRIESIAALHRQLIDQAEDLVDLKKYVAQMLHSVINLVANGQNVITHLEIEEVKMGTKISFPLGLILNELFTNSIKYAGGHNGIIEITLSIQQQKDHILIAYKDSGKALLASEIKSGLGLNIIKLLCAQINASISHAEHNYFEYHFSIPYEQLN